MIFDIITIFPEMFAGIIDSSIIKRAMQKELIEINIIDFRKYTDDRHQRVDDTVYGGGAGMLIKLQPVLSALRSISGYASATKILTTPRGTVLTQKKARELAKLEHIIVICGHYEGIDARISGYVDEEISIGDYILTGGEIPALVLLDCITRLLPGAINSASAAEESFEDGILEHPQYTKPETFEGMSVPSILLSGNHEEVRKYNRYKALEETYRKRPELLKEKEMAEEDEEFLKRIEDAQKGNAKKG